MGQIITHLANMLIAPPDRGGVEALQCERGKQSELKKKVEAAEIYAIRKYANGAKDK